jgi:hypothetical protein
MRLFPFGTCYDVIQDAFRRFYARRDALFSGHWGVIPVSMSDLDCCSLGQRTVTLLALPYLPGGSSPGPCTAFRGLERIYRLMFLADCSWEVS